MLALYAGFTGWKVEAKCKEKSWIIPDLSPGMTDKRKERCSNEAI